MDTEWFCTMASVCVILRDIHITQQRKQKVASTVSETVKTLRESREWQYGIKTYMRNNEGLKLKIHMQSQEVLKHNQPAYVGITLTLTTQAPKYELPTHINRVRYFAQHFRRALVGWSRKIYPLGQDKYLPNLISKTFEFFSMKRLCI